MSGLRSKTLGVVRSRPLTDTYKEKKPFSNSRSSNKKPLKTSNIFNSLIDDFNSPLKDWQDKKSQRNVSTNDEKNVNKSESFSGSLSFDEGAIAELEKIEQGYANLKEERSDTVAANESSTLDTIRHVAKQVPPKEDTLEKPTCSKRRLTEWGLPEEVLRQYHQKGISELFEWQAECLSIGKVLSGGNLVYSAPTSSGKTMVAELLMLKRVVEKKQKAIMILPFVSVAREKMFYLQGMFQNAGVRVDGYMGNHNPPGGFSRVDMAVCTIEKGNSLVNRLLEEGRLETLGVVVVDEMHMLGDDHRGYLLELLLTKLLYASKRIGHSIQIIGMSATLPNLDTLASWLDADLYRTEFRPVPLSEYFKIGSSLCESGSMSEIRKMTSDLISAKDDPDHAVTLCLETVASGHSVLVFCPTKQWCESLAEVITKQFCIHRGKGDSTGSKLSQALDVQEISNVLERLRRSPAGLDSVLGRTIVQGVAFHHAGLSFDERDIVEGAFRHGAVKVLVATTTLSSGVNLPARRVVIRSPMNFGKVMDILSYKQMVGRAGRQGVDTQGESILLCKDSERHHAVSLATGELKPVYSCLLRKGGKSLASSLKRAVLEIISSGMASKPEELTLYMSCTLLSASLDDKEAIQAAVDSCIDYFVREEFLYLRDEQDGGARYIPSKLGKAVLASSLNPDEALHVLGELSKARKNFVLENEMHLIYQITPPYLSDQLGVLDWMHYLNLWSSLPEDIKRVGELVGVEERFLARAVRGNSSGPKQAIHQRFYAALALNDLVHEVKLSEVARKFSCNRGILQSLQQSASTFAGMVTAFCNKLGWHNMEQLVAQFQHRLHFGVQPELCDLVRLSSVNGQRARILYDGGFESMLALANAKPRDIECLLRNSVPFRSNSTETRAIWIDGKAGLNEKEAAELIVSEARFVLQKQLGAASVQWQSSPERTRGDNENDAATVSCKMEAETVSNGVVEQKKTNRPEALIQNLNGACVQDSRRDARAAVNEDVCFAKGHSPDKSEENLEIRTTCVSESDGARNTHSENKVNHMPDKTHSKKLKAKHVVSSCENIGENNLVEKKSCISAIHSEVIKSKVPSRNKENIENSYSFNSNDDGERFLVTKNDSKLVFNNNRVSEKEISGKNKENQSPNARSNTVKKFRNSQSSLKKNHKNRVPQESSPSNDGKFSQENVATSPNNIFDLDANIGDSFFVLSQDLPCDQKLKPSTSSPPVTSSGSSNVLSDSVVKEFNASDWDVTFTPIESPPQNADYILPTPPKSANKDSLLLHAEKHRHPTSPSESSPVGSEVSPTPPKVNRLSSPSPIVRRLTRSRSKVDSSWNSTFYVTPKSSGISREVVHGSRFPCTSSPIASSNAFCIVDVTSDAKLFEVFLQEWKEKEQFSIGLAIQKIPRTDVVGIGAKIGKVSGEVLQDFLVEDDLFVMGIAVCWQDKDAYYISLQSSEHGNAQGTGEDSLCEPPIDRNLSISRRLALIREVLGGDGRRITLLDAKRQMRIFSTTLGVTLGSQTWMDPQVANWMLDPSSKCRSLQGLVINHAPEYRDLVEVADDYTRRGSKCLARVRGCVEVVLTLHTMTTLLEKLHSEGIKEVFLETEMPMVQIVAQLEAGGIGFERRQCDKCLVQLQENLGKLEKKAHLLAKRSFNLISLTEVTKVLYKELRLGVGVPVKKDASKRSLEYLKKEHPLPGLILEWRKVSTALSKTILPIVKSKSFCSRRNMHRICASYDLFTSTGRIVTFSPNLQAVHREFDLSTHAEAINLRDSFVPAKGRLLLAADYSQLELRILAFMSGDGKLLKALNGGCDIFIAVASAMNAISAAQVSDAQRQQAKQVSYGIIYGMGCRALAEQLNVEEDEATVFMDTFKSTYPGVKDFVATVIRECGERGYVSTLHGRKRYLPSISSKNAVSRSAAERQAVNTTIQGSAADLVKKATVRIHRDFNAMTPRIPGVGGEGLQFSGHDVPQLVLQLHDELIYEVDESQLPIATQIIRRNMEGVAPSGVKLPVKLKAGLRWGSLKEISST